MGFLSSTAIRALWIGAVAATAFVHATAAAQVFTVESTDDTPDVLPGDGICDDGTGQVTLRAAIMECNALAGDQTIVLPPGLYLLTLAGAGENACATGDLDVTNVSGALTILGTDATTTVIDGSLSGDRVLHVRPGASLFLEGVTLTGGSAPPDADPYPMAGGGAAPVQQASATFTDTVIGSSTVMATALPLSTSGRLSSRSRIVTGTACSMLKRSHSAPTPTIPIRTATGCSTARR